MQFCNKKKDCFHCKYENVCYENPLFVEEFVKSDDNALQESDLFGTANLYCEVLVEWPVFTL